MGIQTIDVVLLIDHIKKTPNTYVITFKDGSELELTKSEYDKRNKYFNYELDTLIDLG